MNSPVAHVERQRRSYVQPAPDHEYVEGFATNLYHDRTFDCQAAKILPGEYFVTTRDMLLVTVLGSCVAACIRDSENGIGGMNHFMLPDEGGKDVVSSSARYGTYAMEMLINHLLKSGARRNRLEAKVFGGGAVLESLSSSNVGARNAEFVLKDSGGGQGSARFLSAQGLLLPECWPRVGTQVAQGTQRHPVQSREGIQIAYRALEGRGRYRTVHLIGHTG